MSTSCMAVLHNDFTTRMYIELVTPKSTETWDICLHYSLLNAQNAEVRAKQFVLECLTFEDRSTQIAAMFCLMYEEALTKVGRSSSIARMVLHIFRKISITSLISSTERGHTTVRSSDLNHLAEIVTKCIRLVPRDSSVSFDFAEFTTLALNFISTSCAASDVLESMRKTYIIPGNDLLILLDGDERANLSELLEKGGELRVIPCL
jgi:hypothetical protein